MDEPQWGTVWGNAGLQVVWQPCYYKVPVSGSAEMSDLMGEKDSGQK